MVSPSGRLNLIAGALPAADAPHHRVDLVHTSHIPAFLRAANIDQTIAC
jgi:hypothetical protein